MIWCCLWEFQLLHDSDTTLWVADDTAHHPTGIGFLKVPILDKSGFLLICTFYTPSLPMTIISPSSITSDIGCDGYSSFANLDGQKCCLTLHGCHPNQTITFPLQLCHGLLFMHALQPPPVHGSSTIAQCTCQSDMLSPRNEVFSIQHLTKQQTLHLWHQCLGHINHHSIAEMHCFATGIPCIAILTDLDNCPICLSSKLHCAHQGKLDTRHATWCYQGLSIDFVFLFSNLLILIICINFKDSMEKLAIVLLHVILVECYSVNLSNPRPHLWISSIAG